MSALEKELQKLELKPYIAVMAVLNCTEKTAKKKLNGESPFTVPEAVKIISVYFKGKKITLDYLFSTDKAS